MELQKAFVSLMRSALSEMRGWVHDDDFGDREARRRQILLRYRWTREGRGIAT
jgi:hypothetical protein